MLKVLSLMETITPGDAGKPCSSHLLPARRKLYLFPSLSFRLRTVALLGAMSKYRIQQAPH